MSPFLIHYGPWALGFFILGLLIVRDERPITKLMFGLAAVLVPPTFLVVLYFAAGSAGCSGGGCIGAMIALGLLAVPVAAIVVIGLGMVIEASLRWAFGPRS